MRDHPAHGVPMLAGMWGMRLTNGAARPVFIQLFHNMLSHGTVWNRTLDQGFNSIDLTKCFLHRYTNPIFFLAAHYPNTRPKILNVN